MDTLQDELTMGQVESGGADRWIRVRNAALQYVGVGWFLTQVIAVMARDFGWSPKVSDYLVIALGLGFVLTVATTLIMSGHPRSRRVRTRGLLVAGLAALAGLAVWLMSGGQPSVRGGQVGIIHESRGLFSTATDVAAFFVVYPQQPFMPTGIRVKRGQTISIWAEGRTNVGLARLVEAAQVGDDVAYEWVGPDGEIDATGQPVLRQDRGRPGREQCLVNGSFPYGSLLLLISPTERVTPGTAREFEPGREIFAAGSQLETKAEINGFLVLGINDVYLDREECDPEWHAAGRNPNIFFLDNIGFFSARVQVR